MILKKKLIFMLLPVCSLFLILEFTGCYLSAHGRTNTGEKGVSAMSINKLKSRKSYLEARISKLSPKGTYVVIDTAANRLYMKKNGETIREMIVSTGSGSVLEETSGGRKWVFDTPRGELEIQSKKVDPVWIKPDWAFLEEGEDVPKSFRERVEENVLGDYAMSLGNGYLIHGTLYTRLLGRNVTHGCVRVGDEDLKTLYNSTKLGTKVIIF